MKTSLHPAIGAREHGTLPVGDSHALYWERVGKSGGIPIIWLHGGPGSGCTPTHRRYFDPKLFDVVLMDQRGCGRSTPLFDLTYNTTQHLIEDLEALRAALKIDRWIVAGASWGSTLALAYALAHPQAVSGLLVEGVFLGSAKELAWWHTVTGAGKFFPDAFETFLQGEAPPDIANIPDFFRDQLARMLKEIDGGLEILGMLDDPDTPVETLRSSLLYRWTEYEERLSWLDVSPEQARASLSARGIDYVVAHSLIEAHYFANSCFLEDDQLIANADHLSDIPIEIINSRYDIVCPPDAAYRLKTACPQARLTLIQKNGHAMSEEVYPALMASLKRLAAHAG